MGVCLYLALMKRLLGNRFRFALLDDVVMSVDADHRKQFCKLLKNHFPNTQFIITTHDKIWAKQMQTEHLVEYKASPYISRIGPEKAALFGIKRLTRTFQKPNKGGPYDDRV